MPSRFSSLHLFLVAIVACLAVAAPNGVSAQPAPEGVDIVNSASARYSNGASVETTNSNSVVTRVDTWHALRFSPVGSVSAPAFSLVGAPGDTLYCQLQLENLGNAPDSVDVASTTLAPSSLTPQGVIVFLDADGNGRFDPGEQDPAFLEISVGASTPVDIGFILPPIGGGMANVEIRATSSPVHIPKRHGLPATDATVVHVTSAAGPASLHLGPVGNAQAQPGGEGSTDDWSSVAIGLYDESVILPAEIENSGDADSIEVFLPGVGTLPAGVSFECTDVNGVPYSPMAQPGRFSVGLFAAGESRPVRFVMNSPGTPLRVAFGGSTSLDFTAQSTVDPLVFNSTRVELQAAQAPDPRTILGLEQTFRQSTGVLGDIVTMVVTATNRTDSVSVAQVVVSELPDPALDFLGGPDARLVDGRVEWNAGTLMPGESATAALKFTVNGREDKGWARVSGVASGQAQTGALAQTGSIIAAIRIDNEEFGIEGFLLGDVWIDEDEDGRRDPGEPGAGNVSIYLESGEYAVTDSSGVFSIPHVFEGWRAVRLDEGTIPENTELVHAPVDQRGAYRPNERLVHLIAPAHARVAFPLRRTPPEPPAPPPTRTAALLLQEHLQLEERPGRKPDFTLPSYQFGLGKSELRVEALPDLLPLAQFLMAHPGLYVSIQGHTDDIPVRAGPYSSNLELSFARAATVRSALVDMGIAPERFHISGYGEKRPIAANDTPEGRAQNRRVDIVLVSTDGKEVKTPVVDGLDESIFPAPPDSVRSTLRWSFRSTAQRPQQLSLSFDLPEGVHEEELDVRLGDAQLQPQDGLYFVDALDDDQPLDCSVSFTVVEADTQAITGLRARLRLQESGAASDSLAREVILRPESIAPSSRSAQLLDWEEIAAKAELEPIEAPRDTLAAPIPHPVAILEPADGSVVSSRDQVTVRVRHPLGSQIELRVDGELIDSDRLGQRDVDVAQDREITTWYAVRLAAGWNQLRTSAVLLDGSEEADSSRVALATRPAEIVPLDIRTLIPADGHSSATLQFAVRDGFGLPVMNGIKAELIEGAAVVDGADLRSDRGRLQLQTQGGTVSVPIAPSHATGNARVVVEVDGMRAETEVVYVNPERPLLMTGVLGAGVGHYNKSGDGSGQGIDHFTDGFDGEAEARAFVQGAGPRGFRMTARLDTRKRYDDPLLKQPDPERQYPIYGDASEVHYAAPSRGGNYVSFDKGQSYLRYSDFETPIDRGEFLSYRQVSTGVSGAAVDGSRSLRGFVSQSEYLTQTDDLPADGTSGFFYLSQAPIVENSERVIVETRDRYQTEKVLEARVMMRRRDYTINPYDGSILFFEAIPASDRDLNPNFIVVTYETEDGDTDMVLMGGRGDIGIGDRHRAGVTAVTNVGDEPHYSLIGADGESHLGPLRLAGEVAQSDDPQVGVGSAYKLGAGVQRGHSKLDLYLRKVDGDFSNPSFRAADTELASTKAGFEGRLATKRGVALFADGYTHELSRTGERRSTVLTRAEYRRRLMELSAGMRWADHEQPQLDQSGVLSVLGFGIGSRSGTGLTTIWEQNLGADVVQDYPNRIRTKLGVPLSERFRAVGTHELLNGKGRASSQQLTAGVEGATEGGTQAYMRYSMDRTASDDRMGAVSGVRQQLSLGDNTGATFGIEGLRSMSGRRDDEYVAVRTGVASREADRYFSEAGYEYRWEHLGNKHLLRYSGARQLDHGIALLAKNILGLNARNEQNDGTQWYATLAGAYRSPHNPVQSLLMVKSYYDRHMPFDPDATTWRLVLSTDWNLFYAPKHELRLKYAYKHAENESYGSRYSTDTDLILAQHVWHFARSWDLDLWGRTAGIRRGQTSQAGAGIEVGRLFLRSVRVGVGYSVNGFDDPDITGTEAWSSGFGLRFTMLLTDWILSDFAGLR